ncbi:MAG: hypothetical protein ACI33P_03380 [Lysinibacillus sp.]
MKRISLLCLVLLAGCTNGGIESVSQMLPESEPAEQETMTAQVKVYSVAGSTDGTVFLTEGRDKWIVTEAAVFRDHPKALIETSHGQHLEAELEAVDVESNIAILHMRNSAGVEASEQVDQQRLEAMLEAEELTARDRYKLQEAFEEAKVPRKYDLKVLEDYEKPTFTYNPDAIEHVIHTFNTAFNQYVETGDFSVAEPYILSDLLKEALQKEEAKLVIEDIEVSEIVQSNFEWHVKGATKDFAITYNVNLVDGTYYITYIHIER